MQHATNTTATVMRVCSQKKSNQSLSV